MTRSAALHRRTLQAVDTAFIGRAAIRALYAEVALDPKPGLTVVEIVHAILDNKIHGMYVMGENPAMSDPDAHHAREALAKLEHLVVQEIFLTETCYHADVMQQLRRAARSLLVLDHHKTADEVLPLCTSTAIDALTCARLDHRAWTAPKKSRPVPTLSCALGAYM